MTICPCCGFKFEGDLRHGCAGCGARAVGAPLPKPERELPAYGRPLLLAVTGPLIVLGFLGETVIALVQHAMPPFQLWSWTAAAETAAWRLKWIGIPLTLIVLWGGRRVYRSMLRTPSRFVGLRMARRGLLASGAASLLIATLIGVTVPARLEQRRIALQAEQLVYGHTLARAQLEYQALHGFCPNLITDLRQLPDPDASIAAALATLPNVDDPGGYPGYKPSTELAAIADEKPGARRPTVFRKASLNQAGDETLGGGVSLTTYELRLPGEDKVNFTDDDLILRDGVLYTVSQANEKIAPTRSLSQKR